MKLHTLTLLQNFLDKEFAWRIKEIAELKTAVRLSKYPSRKTVIRAGIPLLYAHWEGFVKQAFEAYIEFVSCQKLSLDQLQSNFVVLGVKKYVETLVVTRKSKLNIDAVEFIRNQMSKRADIKLRAAIDTESNLSSAVFENLAIAVGIELSKYEPRFHFIDESILKRRNNIAHGEYLEVDDKTFLELANDLLCILRWVKTDIENAGSMGAYRIDAPHKSECLA